MSNFNEQLEALYDVQESDLEVFSKIEEDGSLNIDWDSITILRVQRMTMLFKAIDSSFKNDTHLTMYFMDKLLDWMIQKMDSLGSTENEQFEKYCLIRFARLMKERYDDITE